MLQCDRLFIRAGFYVQVGSTLQVVHCTLHGKNGNEFDLTPFTEKPASVISGIRVAAGDYGLRELMTLHFLEVEGNVINK